jgi:hypothetical protein
MIEALKRLFGDTAQATRTIDAEHVPPSRGGGAAGGGGARRLSRRTRKKKRRWQNCSGQAAAQ